MSYNVHKELEDWRARDPLKHAYTISMVEGACHVRLTALYNGQCTQWDAIQAAPGYTWDDMVSALEDLLADALQAESIYLADLHKATPARMVRTMCSAGNIVWAKVERHLQAAFTADLPEALKKKVDGYTPAAKQLPPAPLGLASLRKGGLS